MYLIVNNFLNRIAPYLYFFSFIIAIDCFFFLSISTPNIILSISDGFMYLVTYDFCINSIQYSLYIYILLILNAYFMLSYLGLYGVFLSGLFGVLIFWFNLLINLKDVLLNNININVILFKWFSIGNGITVNFELLIDPISFSFAFLTTSIALFVNIYTFSYFRYEPNIDRLLLLLNSFVISMVLLVLSGNLIVLFLGWELIGLTSFLLINFWSTRVGTLKSAFKAYSFNKYSDFLIFLGIILIGLVFNDFNISNILLNFEKFTSFYLINIFNFKLFDLICFFFLGAAFIKSAQIGFHIWLPDSMEAPVPASALIHSATLVSAGIFLILRLYPLFENSTIFYIITPIVGISTALYGGLVAFYQNDLKRILAYSTISHCGFLMFLTTLGSFEFIILYLYVHGFFKAIAFLCVGNIIRFSKNYQDIRRMGQFWKYLPYEFSIILLSLMNLSGLPFFFGFYIKHLVFITVDNILFYQIIYAILFLAALTGTFYFYKILFYVFFDTKKARKSIYLSSSKKNLCSIFYSNASNAGIWSILLLTIVAYYIIFYFFNELLNFNNIYFNSSFYKNQDYQLFNYDNMLLFNYAFLNWVVVMCLFFLTYIRWNNSLDLVENITSIFSYLVILIISLYSLYLIGLFNL